MKQELSILIPTYNTKCAGLVKALHRQAMQIEGLKFEILVADDGSTNQKTTTENNREISMLPHCSYLIRPTNGGRAAIRNYLAQSASSEWLLFLDCDVEIPPGFLRCYLECDDLAQVVYGGIHIESNEESQKKTNLRYKYEKSAEKRFAASLRARHPYQSFRTTNFMSSRLILLTHPFDIEISTYGYEDVLFGKELETHGIPLLHIDNAVINRDYEPNPVFLDKTEEALRTLARHQESLKGYSHLLSLQQQIDRLHCSWIVRLLFRSMRKIGRQHLCGSRPSLWIYKLYRIGYFSTCLAEDKSGGR